jgi:uncharacterized protein YutE (UPF0331/DUF86 family)
MEGYLADLRLLDDAGLSGFQNDLKSQRFAERTLQIMLEAMLDVAHHIISDERFREPDSYADAFVVLTEQKILDEDFLETAKRMAQFRNKLVHGYEKVATEMVYAIATEKRCDVERFIDSVKSWLAKS